jgi:hypothetical protein
MIYTILGQHSTEGSNGIWNHSRDPIVVAIAMSHHPCEEPDRSYTCLCWSSGQLLRRHPIQHSLGLVWKHSNALQSIRIERGGLVSFPLQSIWIGRDWVYPNKLLRGFHHGIAGGQSLSLLLAFAEQYLHSDIAAICLGKHGQLNEVELFLISTTNLRYSANVTLHCSLPIFFWKRL